MQIINVPKLGNSTVIMMMANAGSRFENPKFKGISHFVEHACFKGTKNRNRKEIVLGIERYGGMLNAFTDDEITAYYAKIANSYRKKAVDIIQDMTMNPIFPSKEITKERKVILEELKMHQDNPRNVIFDYFNKYLFKSSSGLYLPTIGTTETLKRISKKKLEEYHTNNYEHLTLIQVGNVKEKNIIAPFKEKALPEKLPKKEKNRILITRNDISQANVVIGNYINLLGLSRMDRLAIFKVLSGIHNSMSGRLFNLIREKHNLVYNIRFSATLLSCGGIIWGVNLGLKPNKIKKAYDLIIKELTRPIIKEELGYAITKLLGAQALAFDDVYHMAETTAYCISNGLDYKEVIYNYKKYYEKVAKDINEYQKRINFADNICVGIVPKE